jgi:hypothetical protein
LPLEDEILQIAVFNKDLGEVVISEEFTVSIPLAGEITETSQGIEYEIGFRLLDS